MIKPLALVVYEQLLPGTQLINRLQDLGYRVQTLTDPATLVAHARQELPLVILADLVGADKDVASAIGDLRITPETRHIPVLAFAPPEPAELREAAREAGATLVASRDRILEQLDALLDQVLNVD